MHLCELMRLRILRQIVSIHKQTSRGICLTKAVHISPNNVTEVRIPVPWGHIAGKWWGDVGRQPILAVHGWQDNAGSWDPLLERLPECRPVLAMDFPGHGLSSHFPEAMLYHNANYVMALRRLQQHFQWNSDLTIMGHSAGGVIGFLFSVLYPEVVKTLISIDIITPLPKWSPQDVGSEMDKLITNSKSDPNKNPKYTLTDIENRWLKGTRGSLTKDAVGILLKRGVKLDSVSDKYSYMRDPKVKIDSLQRFSEEQSLELSQNLKCHYLVIRCTEGQFLDYASKNMPDFIKTLSESAKSFKLVNVEGQHHVHLTHPDRVLPVISEFLNTVDASQ